MTRREVELPPYIEEGALAGALHALNYPLPKNETLLLETYDVARIAVLDCMSVLPAGFSYIATNKSGVLISRFDEDVKSVRIVENSDIERGLDYKRDRITVFDKEFLTSEEVVSGTEERWVLTNDTAIFGVKRGNNEYEENKLISDSDIAIFSILLMRKLAGLRAEIGRLAQRPTTRL